MNRITGFEILSVKMEGFKKFLEPYEVNLDNLTYVIGSNGQGKSTIADAIAYAFCGTSFWGEKNSDRLKNPAANTMKVELQLVDQDGEIHSLSRIKSGNSTAVAFDTIPVRQADIYNRFAEKDVLLSILNPLYFIEKIAEDGREFLQKLLPSISKDDVLTELSENTRTILEKENILDVEYYLKKKREEIREIEDNCTYLEGQADLLKTQKRDAEAKLDELIERGESLARRRSCLENKQFEGLDIDALKHKYSALTSEGNSDEYRKLLERKKEAETRTYVSQTRDDIVKTETEIKAAKAKCDKLATQARTLKVGDVCPVCHCQVTESNYMEIIGSIKKEYDAERKTGEDLQARYYDLIELESRCRRKFDEFRENDLKQIEDAIAAFEKPSEEEIKEIERTLKFGNLTEAEYEELQSLTFEAEDYAKEVENLSSHSTMTDKAAEIQKQISAEKSKIIEIRNLIHSAEEFAAKRAELTLQQLKMNHAAIKLFDVVKTTGEIKNVFRFTYDNKDYRWLSTSEKIRAGLEVSNLLRRLTNLIYPTYIDNAECITERIDPVFGQVIFAFARKSELTVRCLKKEQAAMKEAA